MPPVPRDVRAPMASLGEGGTAFSCGARAAAECAKGQKGKFFVSDVQDIPGARKIFATALMHADPSRTMLSKGLGRL